ncbi:ABC transporter permease [Ornithinimicrobium cryptoxanthini]|uniref:ABC transporter permease n=1 Tax=Ornithinimicrobium cryptoxanthini TaxID=2934161 RepID=UPI00211996B6|nr:ABC transporter permease [Ornithinimicrobium cryptoxanthini]
MTDNIQDLRRLAASGRVPAPEVLAARSRRWGWWYFVEYWLRTARAWFVSILVYMVGKPLLYLVALGLGLGALVDSGVGTVDGVSYLVFVAPALLISTVVMSTGGELTYPVMAGFKWDRLYYGPAATPVTPAQIAVGQFLGVMIRFTLQAAIFWAMLLAFGAAPRGWAISLLTIPIAVLTAAAFGAPLQAYAASLTDEGYQFAFVQRFVIMPMFLFAGTFFPLSSMPGYLHWIGWVSPVWHGTQLSRQVTYGAVEPAWLTVVHIAFLVVLTALGLVWARRNYTVRLGS